MSVKLAKEEIIRFLGSDDPEVLCISGKWGAGKTFAWNYYLKECLKDGKIAPRFKTYAYISLFGHNSLQDVRATIFPSLVNFNEIMAGPSVKGFQEKIKYYVRKWRKLGPQFSDAVKTKIPITNLEQIYTLFIKNAIICFDDIERHGKALDVKDILGLASNLKEEKKCKVIIILNDEVLEGTDGKDFKEQLEKVVDTYIKFEPTPEEASIIALDKDSSFYSILAADCSKLRIVNIRVIRKIQRLAYQLADILKDLDPRVLDASIHSLVLIAWASYQPAEAIPIAFIKSHSGFSKMLRSSTEQQDVSEDDNTREGILAAYGWSHFDEYDEEIAHSVSRGYFDPTAIKEKAKKLETRIKADAQEDSFSKAWDLYRGSFDDNSDEVLDNLYSSLKENVTTISPGGLDGTVRLLKEFGRTEQASELITKYVNEHGGDKKFFDLSEYFFDDVRDPDVIEAFKQKASSFIDHRNPVNVLESIVKNRGWNREDIELLKKLTADDFYRIFKDAKGDRKHSAIYGALTFRKTQGLTNGEEGISEKAVEALQRIARESPMNKRRVQLYGISIEEPEHTTQPTNTDQ